MGFRYPIRQVGRIRYAYGSLLPAALLSFVDRLGEDNRKPDEVCYYIIWSGAGV